MNKKLIKLTESELNRMISKAIRKTLNEGTTDEEITQKWEELKEVVGCEQMVEDIFNYLSSDQIEQLVEWFNQDYEMW